jgi:Rrf2 family protein
MSIIFSKKCEYGIQAILFLSSRQDTEAVRAEDIANALQIPREFVSKILQELTFSGIVDSKKGKSGGFLLAKPTAKIRLIDVVVAIDGFDIFNKCVLGFPNCSSESPCPVHHNWSKLSKETYTMLAEATLDEFVEKTKKKIESIQDGQAASQS